MGNKKTRVLGLDIAKATFEAVLLNSRNTVHRGSFANTPEGFGHLRAWLKRHARGPVHACMEATGRYGEALALFLYDKGHTVSVVNPARIKAYGQSQLQRNKTDRQDALLIADFCRTQQPAPWAPPAPEWRELQELERQLDDLQVELQQHKNRLGAGYASERARHTEEQIVAFLKEQVAMLKKQIQDLSDRHEHLKRDRGLLCTIPGIGALTACKLLGEIGDFRRFDNADQLAAFIGLTPSQSSSGRTHYRPPHLSKTGSALARKHLFMPCLVAIQHNPAIRALAERLRAAAKPPMVINGAAMHKLIRQCFGVLKSGKPFTLELAMPHGALGQS
jgi:transposase